MTDTAVDDIAARALGAMILDATALAIAENGEEAERALTELCRDSGLILEVCAAILYATSFVAGIGDVPPADLFAASLAWAPDPDELEPGTVTDDGGVVASPDGTIAELTPAVIEPLTPADSGRPCTYCDNAAIGRVANVRVCFMHTDTQEATADPSGAPFRDENEDGKGEEE